MAASDPAPDPDPGSGSGPGPDSGSGPGIGSGSGRHGPQTAGTDRSRFSALCVYCASSSGTNPSFAAATKVMGQVLAERNIELVYGGGAVGLMGLVADTVLDAGGKVTGIIPSALMPAEVAHRGLTRLIEVDSMHSRKAGMIEWSDGFVALPGGFGTLEELAEVLTWAQLAIHDKPVGLLNIDGFYDDLLRFLDRAVTDGVLKAKNRELLITATEPEELLAAMEEHQPTHEPKWSDLDRL